MRLSLAFRSEAADRDIALARVHSIFHRYRWCLPYPDRILIVKVGTTIGHFPRRSDVKDQIWNADAAAELLSDTEASMHAIEDLSDGYIPRHSEMIRLEFAVRELGELCAPGSADTAEHMFARALTEKLTGISEREQPRYLQAA
jgi:hypothetical protein